MLIQIVRDIVPDSDMPFWIAIAWSHRAERRRIPPLRYCGRKKEAAKVRVGERVRKERRKKGKKET